MEVVLTLSRLGRTPLEETNRPSPPPTTSETPNLVGPSGAVALEAPITTIDQPPTLALLALDVQECPAVASETGSPGVALIR